MQERKALGKGLSSLIPLGNRSDNGNKVYFECPLEDIIPNQNQPRKLFDKIGIDELAASIEEKGVIQPLIVRRFGGGKYELIAGERRYRAALSINLEKIPVIIKDVEDQESLELALIENLQRRDLNPVEEALAYKELLSKYQYTQDELAKRIGKDRSSITNILRILKLPDNIRAYIISGKISMGHARALLAIENHELQQKIAGEILQHELSVRDIENLARRFKEAETEEPAETATSIENAQTGTSESPVKNLEEELKKLLKTQVQIRSSSGEKGKVIIHYHSYEELNSLFDVLAQNR